jgi:hypothetical protein
MDIKGSLQAKALLSLLFHVPPISMLTKTGPGRAPDRTDVFGAQRCSEARLGTAQLFKKHLSLS